VSRPQGSLSRRERVEVSRVISSFQFVSCEFAGRVVPMQSGRIETGGEAQCGLDTPSPLRYEAYSTGIDAKMNRPCFLAFLLW
jgi:hypothetical protein